MAEIILHATPRPPQGTRPARRLRAEGKVPGVVYGLGGHPIPLAVVWKDLRAALVTEQGLNAVINLEIEGETTPTLVRDIQRHKVRRDVLHIDFIRVDLDKPVDVDVQIHLTGEAEAVSREGGVVDQVMTALQIHAKPADIPSQLTIDITGLEIGSALRVSDIVLPAGVTTSVDPEDAVVTGSHGISEEQLEAAEAEAAGEGAEGEEITKDEDAAEGEEASEGAAEGEAPEGDSEG
ncbi:MAG: 50S ribosomal protein L25 [Acidimicrobiales bacterium]